jgi:hypothetical protein
MSIAANLHPVVAERAPDPRSTASLNISVGITSMADARANTSP